MSNVTEVDLPPNLSCLKNIDTLLRCPICFDFVNIAMMTRCSHNFCSLCIRKFLSYKLQCPVCNLAMTEQDLRNNRILDDLVQSFQIARQKLCQANFDSPPISPKTPSSALKPKLARQGGPRKEGTILSHFLQKRPPTSPLAGVREKSSRRDGFSPGPGASKPVKEEPEEVGIRGQVRVKEEEAQEELQLSGMMDRVKMERTDSSVSPSTSQDVKPVVKVECPVCGVAVPQQHINKHLDMCLTREEKKEGLRRSDQLAPPSSPFLMPNSGKRRPITKLVYTLLTVQELKKKLRECHLSTQGSRDQLIRRHQDFVHIYNAQCDALSPRSAEDIAREVENNEKTRNQLERKNERAVVKTKNLTSKEVEELNSNYRKQHSSEFSRLIAQVKSRMKTSARGQATREEKETGETTCRSGNAILSNASPSVSSKPEVDESEVIEVLSRSPSPSLSEVSVSR
ncbi:E3 ubiquitin-protein ligase RAD18 [Chanos chanos]|uniref:RING-type E3 ubiquitin transferase n=1 Tax=Chanos chanos TaxID=29144 RepID=A0A6J2VNH3_CHACN|nr:E3 ubiquitin-protein ligase RAD18 [Chanos chanos]